MADPHAPSSPARPGALAPQPEGAGDPSMEDILASIRRILNEDEAATTPANPQSQPPPAASPPAAEEPLDLTREMLVGDPSGATSPPPVSPALVRPAQTAAQAPADPPPAPAASPPAAPSGSADALLAPAAAAAASASLGSLLRAVAAERGSGVARSGGPSI
jgi:uncharacterized protein